MLNHLTVLESSVDVDFCLETDAETDELISTVGSIRLDAFE